MELFDGDVDPQRFGGWRIDGWWEFSLASTQSIAGDALNDVRRDKI
jgi:hypothetical protein